MSKRVTVLRGRNIFGEAIEVRITTQSSHFMRDEHSRAQREVTHQIMAAIPGNTKLPFMLPELRAKGGGL